MEAYAIPLLPGWLLLSIAGLFWNDYQKLNRNYLLLGSGLGLLIPFVNGFVTRDWMWTTLSKGEYYVFSVDASWLVIGISGLLICRYYLQKKETVQKTLRNNEGLTDFIEERTPILHRISETKL